MRSTDHNGYIHIQTANLTRYPIFIDLVLSAADWAGGFFVALKQREGIFSKGAWMARTKKTEGGQGGKRGHSNMVHHEKTAVIKEAANRHRREEARQIVQSDLAGMLDSKKAAA